MQSVPRQNQQIPSSHPLNHADGVDGMSHQSSPVNDLSWMDRLRKQWTPPRRIRPTRAGMGFLGLSLAIGFAALNTGNNLLYLVLGMMLSLLSLSGVLSELSVRRLKVSRQVTEELVAGEDKLVRLTIENPRRFFPAFGIWVEEEWPSGSDGLPVHAVFIAPRSTLTLRTHWRFTVRGVYHFRRIEVLTLFPFGFFRRSFTRDVPLTVQVLPPIVPVKLMRGGMPEREGEVAHPRRGSGDDYYGLRHFQVGDDPRFIHWRTSARQGRLVAREQAEQQRRRVWLVLEVTSSLPEESVYEEGIIQLASYAIAYLRAGYEVAVLAPGVQVPLGAGESHGRVIRRRLAQAPRAAEAADLPESSDTGAAKANAFLSRSREGALFIRVGRQLQVEARL